MFRTLALLAAGIVAAVPLSASAQTNLALGRPYTLSPRPNYALTTDAGDDTQLTDGAYANWNPIWTKTSTVGWSNAAPVTIVIDLQSVQSIAGVTYSTAAGKAGVQWPRSIFVLTSDDGQHYFPAVDLAAIPTGGAGPPASGYAPFRFSTSGLRTHGRYVAIVVDQNGPFTFCDEIEVLAGDTSWLASPLAGEMTTDLSKYFVTAHMRVSILGRLSADLQDARAALAASQIDDTNRAYLASTLDEAAVEIAATPRPDPATFTTVLPLNDLHRRILSVHGAIGRAEGLRSLSAWVVNPWDFVRPLDKPPISGGTGTVRVAAMNGETRAGAVNFLNATDQPMIVSLQLTDATGTAPVSDVRMYEVPWTDTRELIPVADALRPLSSAGATFEVPAGITRQVWLSFTAQHRSPGVYRGFLDADVGGELLAHVPIVWTVFSGALPERPALHLGGWDYTNRQNYLGLTAANVGPLIDQLQSLHVDSPWATSSVMPAGIFDASGRMTHGPDTSLFDRWIASWPDARQYYVFLNAHGTLGSITAAPTAPFATAVMEWMNFWVAHAAQLGIQPSQLMLLLVDEPSSTSQDNQIVTWATAIKAAQPAVGIWEDPNFTNPAAAPPRSLDFTDVVALERSLIAQFGVPFVQFYQHWATGTRTLNVYGAAGPARLLDPYSYHRLQAWICADIGATGSFFWSFADDAGGASWNEYRTTQAPFSPFFLSGTEVTISKHSEAIREGLDDFEYLTMLRQQAPASGSNLLQHALDAVLRSPGASSEQWGFDKDRSVADSMRLLIADELGLVPPPQPPTIDPVSDLVVEATSAAGAVVTYASPATLDAADGPGVASCAPVSGGTFPLGVTNVTCIAQDAAGQTASSRFAITIRDTVAPVIAQVPDVAAEAMSAAGAIVVYVVPTTSDAVDGDGMATCSPASGSVFPSGTTTIACSAQDAAGNNTASGFAVTIRDTTAPAITTMADISLEAGGPAGAAITYAAPSTSDLVDGAGSAICTPESGTVISPGTVSVICIAGDTAGNVSSVAFQVTVREWTPQVIAIDPPTDSDPLDGDEAGLSADAVAAINAPSARLRDQRRRRDHRQPTHGRERRLSPR